MVLLHFKNNTFALEFTIRPWLLDFLLLKFSLEPLLRSREDCTVFVKRNTINLLFFCPPHWGGGVKNSPPKGGHTKNNELIVGFF